MYTTLQCHLLLCRMDINDKIWFLALKLSILSLILGQLFFTTCNAKTPEGYSSLVLLVSFDGFRWDYLDRGLTPTFNELASNGGKANYTIDAFITKTFPNHYTLVTGLYEESHGLVGNHMYDPVLNETFAFGNLSPSWWSQSGQEPVWITNQRQGGHSAVLDFPGMDVPFDQMLPDFEYVTYNESLPFDSRSDLAVNLLSNGSVNFVALYFSEPDKTGHLSGPFSKEMNETLRRCDENLKYLVDRLKEKNMLSKVNMIITSDHGMAQVDQNNKIYASDHLNITAHPYFTVENNPVLGIWPNNSADLEPLYEAMKKVPYVSVYKKDEVPAQYHYSNNVRIPPIIAVADEGWMIVGDKNTTAHYGGKKGMHGYNNSLPSMHPIFLVHGPAFKTGATTKPFNSVDVYSLTCHLLGIKPRPHNGTLGVVKQLLVKDVVPSSNRDNSHHGSEHSQFFSVGIAFAVVIVLLVIVLLTGMCLQQRKYRQEELTYHTLNDGLDSEDEEIFEDRDHMLPNTKI